MKCHSNDLGRGQCREGWVPITGLGGDGSLCPLSLWGEPSNTISGNVARISEKGPGNTHECGWFCRHVWDTPAWFLSSKFYHWQYEKWLLGICLWWYLKRALLALPLSSNSFILRFVSLTTWIWQKWQQFLLVGFLSNANLPRTQDCPISEGTMSVRRVWQIWTHRSLKVECAVHHAWHRSTSQETNLVPEITFIERSQSLATCRNSLMNGLKSFCVKLKTKHSSRERSHSQNLLLSRLLENAVATACHSPRVWELLSVAWFLRRCLEQRAQLKLKAL